MTELEGKQANCPYCHDRANLLQSNDERPVDGDMVYINKDGYLNLETDWGHVYRIANYCPMCGRKLDNGKEKRKTKPKTKPKANSKKPKTNYIDEVLTQFERK